MVIYKYSIPDGHFPKVTLPYKASVISVGQQNGKLVIWCTVSPNQLDKVYDQDFYVVWTGCEIPRGATYFVGTVQMPDGIVVHVYKGKTPAPNQYRVL